MNSVSAVTYNHHFIEIKETIRKYNEHYRNYIDSGQILTDIEYLFHVYDRKQPFEQQLVMEAIQRVKESLFGTIMPQELCIPESFNKDAIGRIIRFLEYGRVREDRFLSAADICAELQRSKSWVIAMLYDEDDLSITPTQMEGKIPARRNSAGYLVSESVFSEWKNNQYISKKGD
jgi:hypothetical protein